jgi:hypothetical protein
LLIKTKQFWLISIGLLKKESWLLSLANLEVENQH